MAARTEQTSRLHKTTQQSAGLLLFRRRTHIDVLLGHPGGPFWFKKDAGAWTIPKGLISPGEMALAAARREFTEETGHRPRGKVNALGEARQPGSNGSVHGGDRLIETQFLGLRRKPSRGEDFLESAIAL
jgi:8-oxo-dGTP pyrophosphatase MutT (NUDIX family)